MFLLHTVVYFDSMEGLEAEAASETDVSETPGELGDEDVDDDEEDTQPKPPLRYAVKMPQVKQP